MKYWYWFHLNIFVVFSVIVELILIVIECSRLNNITLTLINIETKPPYCKDSANRYVWNNYWLNYHTSDDAGDKQRQLIYHITQLATVMIHELNICWYINWVCIGLFVNPIYAGPGRRVFWTSLTILPSPDLVFSLPLRNIFLI